MIKKIIIIFVIFLLIFGGIKFFSKKNNLEILVVKKSDLKETITTKGRVLANKEAKVATKISGKVVKVYVKDGDWVQPNQLLAKLDDSEIQAQIKQAQAQVKVEKARYQDIDSGVRKQELEQANLDLSKSQARLENAKNDLFRVKSLYAEGALPKAELEAKELSVKINQDQVMQIIQKISLLKEGAKKQTKNVSQSAIIQAKTQINYLKKILNNTLIKAPFRSVVISKDIEVGEIANPLIPLFTLADISILKVILEVDESDIGKIFLGQKVNITADAFPDKIFKAKIIRIGNALGKKKIKTDNPLEMTDTSVLEVEAQLEKKADEFLKIELNVDGELEVFTKNNCLNIPQSAVKQENNKFFIWLKKGNVFREQEIKIGLKTSGSYEVIDGLKENDIIIKYFEKK